MTPETNKVSKCCGDRLCLYSGPESAYTCFECKKPCDATDNCADCFPQHFPFSQGKTVPLCEAHYQGTAIKESLKTDLNKKEACHCVRTSRYHTRDSNYENHTPMRCWTDKIDKNDAYAILIGGIILNVGNIYNENKQDITVRVAEYIYKNYVK